MVFAVSNKSFSSPPVRPAIPSFHAVWPASIWRTNRPQALYKAKLPTTIATAGAIRIHIHISICSLHLSGLIGAQPASISGTDFAFIGYIKRL